MFRTPRLTAAAAVIGSACALLGAGNAFAATYTVSTTADTAVNAGAGTACVNGASCSLRQAVERANANGGGTIDLAAASYALTSGELYIDATSPVIIEGDSTATTTITGNTGEDSLIRVASTTELDDLTVSASGPLKLWGAILVQERSLTLDHVAVTGNTVAPTIGSNVVGAGAGISVEAPTATTAANLTLIASTVSGNTTLDDAGARTGNAQGGGIYFDGGNNGRLVVSRSTISGNKAGVGGGIMIESALSAEIVNSTIAGNDAPSGSGIAVDGTQSAFGASVIKVPVDIDLSTISGNTGSAALFAAGLLSPQSNTIGLHGTIVDQGGSGCSTTSGHALGQAFTDRGQNLDAGISCGTAGLINTDPQLNALAVVDGVTATMVPKPSSPVIDAGTTGSCIAAGASYHGAATKAGVEDQRFDSSDTSIRPIDGDGDGTSKCDIGSVEYYAAVIDGQTATAPTLTGATIAGVVHIGDAPVTAYFQYGVGAALDRKTAPVTVTLDKLENPQSAVLTDLAPNTLFSYRLVAFDGVHTYVTGAHSGRTLGTPVVRNASSDTITALSAKLNTTIDPNGAAGVQTHFEWGTTTAYGTSGPNLPIASLTANTPLSQTISGLIPNTHYYWRAVTTGNGATDFSSVHQFTTLPPTAITVTLGKLKSLSLKKAAKKGLTITATCSSACSLKGQVDVTKSQKKKLKLKATTVGMLASASSTATLKLKKSVVTKLKKGKIKSLTLTLTATPTAIGKAPVTTTTKVKITG